MALYTVQANVTVSIDGYVSTRQAPSFVIDSAIRGERNAQDAARSAIAVLSTLYVGSGLLSITVSAVDRDAGGNGAFLAKQF